MQVPHSEGITYRTGPEPCVSRREVRSEASAGERMGQPLSDETKSTRSADAVCGTIDHTPVYPREVVKRALELQASALILAHNHPSGDPTPSTADIAVTRDIVKAAQPLGVTVHDHLIIGRGRHVSLRDLGLI